MSRSRVVTNVPPDFGKWRKTNSGATNNASGPHEPVWGNPRTRPWSATSSGLRVDHVEAVVDPVQRLGTAGLSDDDVLDAGSEPAVEVDPRLDREGVAYGQRLGVACDHVGVLVFLEADAVAGAVDEL